MDRPLTSVGIPQRALCRTSTVLFRSLCAALFSLTGRPSSDYSFYASVATTRLRPDRLRLPYRRVTTFLSSFPFTAPHLLFYFITLLHLNCFLPPLLSPFTFLRDLLYLLRPAFFLFLHARCSLTRRCISWRRVLYIFYSFHSYAMCTAYVFVASPHGFSSLFLLHRH